MDRSMENEVTEEGALVALGDVMNMSMPDLYNAQNITAWRLNDNRGSSTRSQNVAFFLVQQSFASQRSINAAPLLLMNSNNDDQVHIQVVDEENASWIEDNPERRRVEKKPRLSLRKLDETLLAVASQAGIALFATSYSSGALSPNGTILLHSAVVCNVIGFLCCLYSLLLKGHKPGVARILTGAGFITTVYGFLSVMGMMLQDHLMLWMVSVACMASFPAVAVLWKKTDFQYLFRLKEKT